MQIVNRLVSPLGKCPTGQWGLRMSESLNPNHNLNSNLKEEPASFEKGIQENTSQQKLS